MQFADFFSLATAHPAPFPYQTRLATEPWPDLLDVPTGLGKTAAVTLAWAYKRTVRDDPATPRRLVWCLPMRVLVEQTKEAIDTWLVRLGLADRIPVELLMGGAARHADWLERPEHSQILIGTQDMLLSRALMRGYGMSRFQWPVAFAQLHNDCLWVFDEVQSMGAGLATSAQLEAFRRAWPLPRESRSLWVSATLNRNWLNTVDLRPHWPDLTELRIAADDRSLAGERLAASKPIRRATLALTADTSNKTGLDAYLDALCELVLEAHDPREQTLVVLNRVDRAQQVFKRIRKIRPNQSDLLIHARFRAADRSLLNTRLRTEPGSDRILVATQAIEAGVDLSSRRLITELAPWASMVQRFGRCNRYGEHNADGGASIQWIDIADEDALALPYTPEMLAQARAKLEGLANAGPDALPPTDEPRPETPVIRRKDLLDLFDTDPDLSGFEIDISHYVRDLGLPSVAAFWRDFGADPNRPERQGAPERAELCPVSIGAAKAISGLSPWRWDALAGRWQRVRGSIRPGMTLLLDARAGGYDGELGFTPEAKGRVTPLTPACADPTESFGDDWRSLTPKPVLLADHLAHVASAADALCTTLAQVRHRDAIVEAARWHDVGKAHRAFQAMLLANDEDAATKEGRLWAKGGAGGRAYYAVCGGPGGMTERPYFRHELPSMLAWLAHCGRTDAETDLIAYLIAAHHGKVRMRLRAMPDEPLPPDGRLHARGVWHGDDLPAVLSEATVLDLSPMEIGRGPQGPSWSERTAGLLERHGPFELAWLETLVRLADWRASAAEQEA